MAKRSSVIKDIRAKPNERGKTSHIPRDCDWADCKDIAMIYRGPREKRIHRCWVHRNSVNVTERMKQLKSMGLIW